MGVDGYLVRVLNLADTLYLDQMGSLHLLLRLVVAFVYAFAVALGGSLAEDAIMDPVDAAVAEASIGVAVVAFVDALVVDLGGI